RAPSSNLLLRHNLNGSNIQLLTLLVVPRQKRTFCQLLDQLELFRERPAVQRIPLDASKLVINTLQCFLNRMKHLREQGSKSSPFSTLSDVLHRSERSEEQLSRIDKPLCEAALW